MPKTKLLPSQTLQGKLAQLVQQAITAITANVKNLSSGRYLFTNRVTLVSEPRLAYHPDNDYSQDHFFYGFELSFDVSKFPTVTILVNDKNEDTEHVKLQEYKSLNDLIWIMGELEAESYEAQVDADEFINSTDKYFV